jgi:DNA-binding transcriptional ArsR family regulator
MVFAMSPAKTSPGAPSGTAPMEIPHPVPPQLAELVAQRFRVLGEPMRIKLLDRLREGEASVNELTEALAASQQNVSKHLGVLRGVGFVTRERDGNFVRYSIADQWVFELCEHVCGGMQRQLGDLDALLQGRGGSR